MTLKHLFELAMAGCTCPPVGMIGDYEELEIILNSIDEDYLDINLLEIHDYEIN